MGRDIRRVKRERIPAERPNIEWRPKMTRITLSLLTLLVAGGCGGSNVTAPMSHDADVRLSADQAAREAAVTEVAFEKWFTSYPAMTGNTSFGAGTFAGRLLSRIPFDNGVIIQLEALYTVTDGAGRSFTALIEGKENLQTLTAVLNGVVITDGWMSGAQVHVTFRVITPCALAVGPSVKDTCFRGTIRVQPRG